MTREYVMANLKSLKCGQDEVFVPVEGIDVVYNPNMDGGQFEIFTEDHTQYIAYKDIDECADAIVDEVNINDAIIEEVDMEIKYIDDDIVKETEKLIKERLISIKKRIVRDKLTIQDLVDICNNENVSLDTPISIMGVDYSIIVSITDDHILLDETCCNECDGNCDNCIMTVYY
jgi:hypothetical protein